jgi:hypothetical protein
VADPSNGRDTDGCPSHSRPKTAAPDVLNDPYKDCNHPSCNQNHVIIGFGCSGMKNTPPPSGFAHLILVLLRFIAVIMG